jgi:predicted nuclease of predicted toxin-antitoxin system
MKLFADECLYYVTVEALRVWGHDVITTQETKLVGQIDEVQLQEAVKQQRVLITNDLDFSNIRRYPPANHCGIIVLKIRPAVLKDVHIVLEKLLQNRSQERLNKTLAIVDRNKYRIRRA